MTQPVNHLTVREASDHDADAIVALFVEHGENPYGWDEAKWRYYYREYPEGAPVSIVAEMNGNIVGHYGMLPIKVGDYPAYLGLHAYVSKACRGMEVISALMRAVDKHCNEAGVALICGFANKRFSYIKKTLFKWDVPVWLGFKEGVTPSDINQQRRFHFEYSEAWYRWRFADGDKPYYLSQYKDPENVVRKQLLKSRNAKALLHTNFLDECQCWSPNLVFSEEQKDQFCQPFQIKVYVPELYDQGVDKAENWFIEMGDSDTFQYTPWEKIND